MVEALLHVKMSSPEFERVLNVTATLSTILQFLAGSTVCIGFITKGSTGDASSLPFVAGALNCAAWFKYGVLIRQPAMQVVNFVGELFNVLVFVVTISNDLYYSFRLRIAQYLHCVFLSVFSSSDQRAEASSLCGRVLRYTPRHDFAP